jgi:hypothetical protein
MKQQTRLIGFIEHKKADIKEFAFKQSSNIHETFNGYIPIHKKVVLYRYSCLYTFGMLFKSQLNQLDSFPI